MKKIIMMFFLVTISLIGLTGCSEKSSNEEHKIIEIESDNDVFIQKSEITQNATYYNYIIDGVTIQLFAVKATDGSIRIVFNTCNSCNPSSMSYFLQIGDYFECQNCKNKFHKDEIGLTQSYGCSPISILADSKDENDDTIIIKNSFIETYKSRFDSINIYAN